MKYIAIDSGEYCITRRQFIDVYKPLRSLNIWKRDYVFVSISFSHSPH